MRKFPGVFIFFLSLAVSAEVIVLDGGEYYLKLIEKVKGARRSITAAMYLISLPKDPGADDKVGALLESLAEAGKRGVNVTVIVDDDTNPAEPEKSRNFRGVEWLRQNGVKVVKDTATRSLHGKAVVIDSRICFIGSSNWSGYAFGKNIEFNVYMDDPDAGRVLLGKIHGIRTSSQAGIKPGTCYDIPGNWIKKGGALVQLYSRGAERAFDLLLVLQCFEDTKPGYGEVQKILGLEKLNREQARRAVNRELRKLEKLGVIECSTGLGKPFQYRMISEGEGAMLALPKTFFEWGWNRSLTLRAKMLFLIFLKEMGMETEISCWLTGVYKQYGVNEWIEKGGQELRHAGIIEMTYAAIDEKGHEGPTVVRMPGLYDPREREKEMEAIRAKVGEKDFKLAKSYAEAVFEGWNPERVKDLLNLLAHHDRDILGGIFKQLGKLRADNPRRTMRYGVGILKQKEKISTRGD